MNSTGNLPYYLRIRNELQERILRGRLTPGDKLPAEEELAKQFGVSPSTVKRAIGLLVADGLVERTPGKGTFVGRLSSSKVPLRSFTEEMRERGLRPGRRLIRQEVVRATGELAWHLDVPENSELYAIDTLRTANEIPIALDATYIPRAVCPDLLQHDLALMSPEAILEKQYQIMILQADEYVSARLATEEEASLLALSCPQVLITVERTLEGVGQQRLVYNRTAYCADRYILHFQLRR